MAASGSWMLQGAFYSRDLVEFAISGDLADVEHAALELAAEMLAEELGITLWFLTSYSPNLTLIERLWTFIKKKCLNNLHYATFSKFKSGIDDCFAHVSAC